MWDVTFVWNPNPSEEEINGYEILNYGEHVYTTSGSAITKTLMFGDGDYSFTLRARNTNGFGPETSAIVQTLPPGEPGEAPTSPTGFTITDIVEI